MVSFYWFLMIFFIVGAIIVGLFYWFYWRNKMLKELKYLKPLEILQKRYAMGHIKSDTFNEMKKELESLKSSKIEILQKLYEMGKIDAKTFNEMKKELDDP